MSPSVPRKQELLGQFVRSKSTHRNGPMGIDRQTPSGILNAFDSEKHKFDGGRDNLPSPVE